MAASWHRAVRGPIRNGALTRPGHRGASHRTPQLQLPLFSYCPRPWSLFGSDVQPPVSLLLPRTAAMMIIHAYISFCPVCADCRSGSGPPRNHTPPNSRQKNVTTRPEVIPWPASSPTIRLSDVFPLPAHLQLQPITRWHDIIACAPATWLACKSTGRGAPSLHISPRISLPN